GGRAAGRDFAAGLARAHNAHDLLARGGAGVAGQVVSAVGDRTAGGGTFAVGGFEGDDALLDRRAFEPHGAAHANPAVAAPRRENNRGTRERQQHAAAGPL